MAEPTQSGRAGPGPLRERRISFDTVDGRKLSLLNVRGASEPTRGPVILVHGAGVRSNIFRAPVEVSIIDALVDGGYDPWLLDWRASIDFVATPWTLDQAACFDYPAAVKTVTADTGASRLKAIVHCQGSTSFVMSMVAGLLPEVTTVISNAVSLHPVVPGWSKVKLDWMVPFAGLFTTYVDPHWGVERTGLFSWLFTAFANLTHRECDNQVCKLVSLVYGSGFPALWSHELLSETTHEWLKQEFGFVPLGFHRQMARCVRAGHLVGVDYLPGLPKDFTASPPRTDARFVLFAGQENRCFLADSQARTYEYMNRLRSDYHALHVLPRYGHLDMFLSDDAQRDVFPIMLRELEQDN